jgi:DNA polymerase-3 subunit epsilon
MREIVLDTETTGMDPVQGHRLIEIGCVELFNHMPTGNTWHHYINPEREIDAGAVAVHGITNEKVKDKPVFGELAGSFLDFIGDATLIIHNAEFDLKFLNAELKPFGFGPIQLKNNVIDTLLLARRKYPGQPANLDALCRRFNVDLSGRDLHGALLDSQLLAQVYLELLGGRQHGLGFTGATAVVEETVSETIIIRKTVRPARPHSALAEELERHQAMLESLANHLWGETGAA